MTVEQWAAERATVIHEVIDDTASPLLPQISENTQKPNKIK
jgi:hypothetical protein